MARLFRIFAWHALFQGFLQVDSIRNSVRRRPGGVQTKKDVLVIIDMLNDYDCAFNQQEYGYNKNPWCGDMSGTSFNITKVIAAADKHWDLVVFVQDWLIPTICEVYGWEEENYFCIRGTNGAQPMAELLASVGKKQLRQLAYTKNQNDAFTDKKPNPDLAGPNLPVPVPIDYPDRGYDVKNTFGGKLLVEVLSSHGFGPEDAKLSMVGTLADMCVMTSTVHASFLGFAVDVYEPAIHGGHDGPWDWCNIPRPSSNEPLPDNWQELVWSCQGAAGREAALEYMHAAGATIVYDLPETECEKDGASCECFAERDSNFCNAYPATGHCAAFCGIQQHPACIEDATSCACQQALDSALCNTCPNCGLCADFCGAEGIKACEEDRTSCQCLNSRDSNFCNTCEARGGAGCGTCEGFCGSGSSLVAKKLVRH